MALSLLQTLQSGAEQKSVIISQAVAAMPLLDGRHGIHWIHFGWRPANNVQMHLCPSAHIMPGPILHEANSPQLSMHLC